uniref:Rho GTPase activating protein 40 n=1 Tax=Bubo bubo TaxID=30461 RepID=A0A8C0EZI9_BUBBB
MCSVVCCGFSQIFCPFLKLLEDWVCSREALPFIQSLLCTVACCQSSPLHSSPCKDRLKQVHLTFAPCPMKAPTGFSSCCNPWAEYCARVTLVPRLLREPVFLAGSISGSLPVMTQKGDGSGFWFSVSEVLEALLLLLAFLFSLALLIPCLAEGEAEAEWLQDAGLSDLLGDRASENDNIVLLSTLTKTQAAAVQRRLDTYSRSRRRKNKHPVRDVRDIFGVVSSEKFKIPKGRLGVTRIGDLSAQDMKKIPTLALIELTALCDILGFELKRNKAAKLKTTEKRLFGVPLNTLLENDQKLLPNTKVPLLLQSLLSCLEKRGLETEGILRVSGSQTRIKSLEQKLERDFYTGLFRWDEVHQNDVSGLLKRFIRELPAPLLTAEYLPAFAAVQNIPDLKQRLQALNLLILILPEPNRNTLKALLEFLSKVVARENNNKMNLWNVSTVMAPNLFMHKGLPNKIPEGKEKQLAEGAADVVRMMIHYQDLLWTVSSFLVAQVRKLNESNSKRYQFCDKRIKNLLRKIHADKDKVEKNQIVKVHASLLLKDSLEVHLNNATRVADVLRQFQKNLCQNVYMKRFFSQSLILIGEHCLDPDTYLLDLYHINPHAEWIIKQNPSHPRMF